MKIAFGIIVFNGDYVLREALESIYPFATQILIAEGPVTYWQEKGYYTSFDGTNAVIDSFPDPENKIRVIHSQYTEKDQQCNAYMSMVRDDIDYVWHLDSDEIFKPEDIEKLIQLLEKEKYTSVGFQSISFYGGFDRYITGYEENFEFMRVFKVYPGSTWAKHRPPTIKHTSGHIYPQKHLNFKILAKKYGIRMYHYSYVFPDQVSQKIGYYKKAVSKGISIDNYLDKIYFPWLNGGILDRAEIENTYKGVHEFKPERRGETFTKEFTGIHPTIIQENMDKLMSKFKKQLEAINETG